MKRPEKKFRIGIIANTTKDNVFEVVSSFVQKLYSREFDVLLSDTLSDSLVLKFVKRSAFLDDQNLCKKSDIIISIGGDGTMLATAYIAQFYDKPVLGVNFGKLGFLAEVNINQIDLIFDLLKDGKYEINNRMVITGSCTGHDIETLYAINDIVIDKGGWPKMIELTVTVDNEYLTTFDADGIIVATPTGSTGYSISTGGPIVSPDSDVITLSPISPHSLSIRPIVLPSNKEIVIRADSMHKDIHVNCDGQRVFAFAPPLEIRINKSSRPLKMVHTSLTNYFETLRNKLLWGIDLRKHSINL